MRFPNYGLTFLISVFSIFSPVVLAQERIVCDETCGTTPDAKSVSVGYAVVSPVGRSTVGPIRQAPRLTTLDGKTIAVVGESFMCRITHPEIKRLIERNYPGAKVLLLDEVGTAGPYPAPGIRRKKKDDFEQRLKELKVDAVISGNGGCGLCTPKEVGSCLVAEHIGIPSVIICAPGFSAQARYTAANNGVQVIRVAEYPGAFAMDSDEVLIRNTRQVVWPQVVDALTRQITPQETTACLQAEQAGLRDDVFFGTLEEIDGYFREMKWTDGLPIVPPTYDRVEEMMRFTDCKWDQTVAVLPVAHRNTTAWHVAVNGVMAGCKPEFMPVLIALTKALGDPGFRRTLASTHAWMPYCWLNGPVARQLGIDCGQGEINESANMAIARFMNLALINLCGYYVKQDRMGTFGYPMPWCMAEDEAACVRVGWQPYHVRTGYRMEDNTVTVASALLWGNNMAPSTTDAERIAQLMAWDISERCQFALGSGRQFTFRTVLLTEPVARILAQRYSSVAQLEDCLVDASRRPLRERAFANYYANPGGAKDGGRHNLMQYTGYLRRSEGAAMTEAPEWYCTPEDYIETVPTMQHGMTQFLVTGDNSRNKIQTMPGGACATVKVELPHDWDRLMAERGYRSLSDFRIQSSGKD